MPFLFLHLRIVINSRRCRVQSIKGPNKSYPAIFVVQYVFEGIIIETDLYGKNYIYPYIKFIFIIKQKDKLFWHGNHVLNFVFFPSSILNLDFVL